MPAKGTRKKPEAERRVIAKRYESYLRNRPKQIMREHGIAKDTLHTYAREFRQ